MLEWAVSGLYIDNMVCSTKNPLSTNHHEDNDSFERNFREKRLSLIKTFKTFDNPFIESLPDLINIMSKEVFSLGLKKLLVVTVDTDVVVIAFYAFWDLDLEEFWIEFGRGKDRKWLPVHAYAKALGEEICGVVHFWYAFTGCDVVSHFLGKGNGTKLGKEKSMEYVGKISGGNRDIYQTFVHIKSF